MTDPVALELIGLDPLATAYIQTLAGFIDASNVQPTYVDADDDESTDEVKKEDCEQETVPESTNISKHPLLNSFSTGEYRIIPHPALQGAFQLLPSKRLITQIQMLGVITKQEVKSNRISFVVDDGTGSMDCIWWISSDDVVRKDVVNQRDLDNKELRQYEDEEREAAITREIHSIVARRNELERQTSLGSLVRVYGKLGTFRGCIQLKVHQLCLEKDSNVEPLFWLETCTAWKECYSQHWDVSELRSVIGIEKREYGDY